MTATAFAHDPFSSSLQSVSSRNPFAFPAFPPGSRAHRLESQLTSGNTLPSIQNHERLYALKRFLAGSTLLQHERAEVLSLVASFLQAGVLTERDFLLASLQRLLSLDVSLPWPEVRPLLAQVAELTRAWGQQAA